MSFSPSLFTPDFPAGDRHALHAADLDTANKLAVEYCQLGCQRLVAQEYTSALAAYRSATECDPQLAIAHHGCAEAYYHLGDYAAALVAIDLAIDSNPRGLDLYHQRALIVQALHDSVNL